jgi:hypothetical protein
MIGGGGVGFLERDFVDFGGFESVFDVFFVVGVCF